MTGESTGAMLCHLDRYESIVRFLASKGNLSPGDLADLEYELLLAMGECGRRCVDTCLATSFYGIQNNSSPHTRHTQIPSIWTVESRESINLPAEVEVILRS